MHDGSSPRFRGRSLLSIVLLGIIFVAGGTGTLLPVCHADEVDWSAWESIPVLDHGRLMPLDTFARCVVRDICGRENPRLVPPSDIETLDPKTQEAIRRLFPNGKPRKFSAGELLYSWTAEPEVWNQIPFLKASNQTLREKGLDVPLFSTSGGHLNYASPLEFEEAPNIVDMHDDLSKRQREAQRDGDKFTASHEDKALLDLISAYNLYRSVVFNPNLEGQVGQNFQSQFLDVIEAWRAMAPNLAPWLQMANPEDELSVTINQVSSAVKELSQQLRSRDAKLSQMATTASTLADASANLVTLIEKLRDRVFEASSKTDDSKSDADNAPDEAFLKKGRKMMNQLASQTGQLARSARLLEVSAYDEGQSIRVTPTLNRWALEKERDQSSVLSPWINLQTLLYAPEVVLHGFPLEKVNSIRETFEASKVAYEENATKKLNESLQKLNVQLRELGETLTAKQAKLDLRQPDESLLAKTAYPPVGAFNVELRYNRLDPTLWSWVLTLAAVVCFALSFGYLRTPMAVLAIVLLTLGQVATCYGLVLRMQITKMVPVTNMHETILFVGATTGILTVFYAIFPILQAGLVTAWRLTAWPLSAEARSMDDAQLRLSGPLASSFGRWMIFVVRLALIVTFFYVLAVGSYTPGVDRPVPNGEEAVLHFFPKLTGLSTGGLLGAIVLWIVGGALLVWTAWFMPRTVPALALAVVLTPASWRQQGFRHGLQQAVDRRLYLIAGAVVALLIYLIGYFTPHEVFNRDVGMGMAPALRNNFWLAIHVLIITASYGAGALAWGIGNVAAGIYLFGPYPQGKALPVTHTLANYLYRMMQIAVLLLAAGTITGAIWADFAWGRYWGWDPKEVWALITLFVYLAILHGRWARWIGDFGMAFGSVLGFTSIIIAWYGVNIIGGGLHSYGAASGGFFYVLLGTALNWCFVVAALVRYSIATNVAYVDPNKISELEPEEKTE